MLLDLRKEERIAGVNVCMFYLHPNRDALLERTPLLQLNPAIPGVFGGPYPFGIDPVRALPSFAVLHEHPLCQEKEKCLSSSL